MKITTSNELAEVQLKYRPKVKPSNMKQVRNSGHVNEILRSIWSEDIEYREEFVILLLNKNSKVLGWCKISTGGIGKTIADPKIIFQCALKTNASAIILAHNHPSGNILASESDKLITKKLKSAGKLLDIEVLDHIILTCEKYFSFKDEGLI